MLLKVFCEDCSCDAATRSRICASLYREGIENWQVSREKQ